MPMDMSKPPKTRRGRAIRLEKILATHAAWERRTLADLRTSGFKFNTVEQARRYLQAQKTLASLTFEELVEETARINEIKAKAKANA